SPSRSVSQTAPDWSIVDRRLLLIIAVSDELGNTPPQFAAFDQLPAAGSQVSVAPSTSAFETTIMTMANARVARQFMFHLSMTRTQGNEASFYQRKVTLPNPDNERNGKQIKKLCRSARMLRPVAG